MDDKEIKITEPTQEQTAVALLTELFKTIGVRLEGQNKFEEVYANNFHFEPSVWDLKVIFGQLDQHAGKTDIDWHTAITIPWLQVKFVAYFLRIQAAWYEAQNGPIKAPASVMPIKPQPPTETNDPMAKALYDTCKNIHEEMFGD